jgi:ribosomal protein S18 acetylase RimI-like enzyme
MIRIANNNDLARLAEIELFVSRYNYRDIFPTEFLYKKLTYEYHIEWLTKSFIDMKNNRGIEYYVFEEEDIIKGFFSIGFPIDSNEGEICNTVIDVPFQNKKIGTLLLNYCSELIKSRGRNVIKLQTFEKNIIARNFCEKHGFEKENEYFSEKLGIKFIKYKKNI